MNRDQLLGQARAELTALPDLVDELAKLIADKPNHDVSSYQRKISGSPAPLNIPIAHLVDNRHKPGWEGEDPRTVNLGDRYGIVPTLEAWIRVLVDELDEYPDLAEHPTVRSETGVLLDHWTFIEGRDWAPRLANTILKISATVKTQLGIKPEPEYRCPDCNNRAYMQPGGILACTEVPDHDIVVRDLEQQLRRRPAQSTKDICAEFAIEPVTLRVWKHRQKIKPAPGSHRDKWFPWDVFCLLNPDIAEALERRDEHEPESAESPA